MALLASSRMMEQIYVGNAQADAPENRGWLLGHFKPADEPRHSKDVELKWAIHPRGDQRSQWVAAEKRTALLLLISGRFRVSLPDRTVVLAQEGDYVVFLGISHCWHAEEDSIVLTVRWPSIHGYAAPGHPAGAIL